MWFDGTRHTRSAPTSENATTPPVNGTSQNEAANPDATIAMTYATMSASAITTARCRRSRQPLTDPTSEARGPRWMERSPVGRCH